VYNALLRLLQNSPVTQNPQIVELMIYGENAFRFKIRATVDPTITFQVWVNCNPRHTRYAYQLFKYGNTLLRWDNSPHYPGIASFPHHLHDAQDQVHPATMSGDPLRDLPLVLTEINLYLSTQDTNIEE
jgi:hypothetical protein